MRILKNISLLLCIVTFVCDANAMFRVCNIAVRYIPRSTNSALEGAGNTATLLRRQQLPLVNSVFERQQPPHALFVQNYGTTAGAPGGLNVEDDESDNPFGDEQLIAQVQEALRERDANRIQGNAAFYDQIEDVVYDNQDEEELRLQRAREAIEGVFGETWTLGEVHGIVEQIRTRILVGNGSLYRALISVLHTVNTRALLEAYPIDRPEAYIIRSVLRSLGEYPTPPQLNVSIGYSRIENALDAFCDDPVAFVADLEA